MKIFKDKRLEKSYSNHYQLILIFADYDYYKSLKEKSTRLKAPSRSESNAFATSAACYLNIIVTLLP